MLASNYQSTAQKEFFDFLDLFIEFSNLFVNSVYFFIQRADVIIQYADFTVQHLERFIGSFTYFLRNTVRNAVESFIVKNDFIVVVFLRRYNPIGNRLGKRVVIDCGKGADNLFCNFIRNIVRIKLGKIIGKNGRGLFCNGLFVDCGNVDFLGNFCRHIVVIGLFLAHFRNYVVEFFSNGIRNFFIIEFTADLLSKRSAALVVDENFEIFGFKRTYSERYRVGKLGLVDVVFKRYVRFGVRRLADLGNGNFLRNLLRQKIVVEVYNVLLGNNKFFR